MLLAVVRFEVQMSRFSAVFRDDGPERARTISLRSRPFFFHGNFLCKVISLDYRAGFTLSRSYNPTLGLRVSNTF